MLECGWYCGAAVGAGGGAHLKSVADSAVEFGGFVGTKILPTAPNDHASNSILSPADGSTSIFRSSSTSCS